MLQLYLSDEQFYCLLTCVDRGLRLYGISQSSMFSMMTRQLNGMTNFLLMWYLTFSCAYIKPCMPCLFPIAINVIDECHVSHPNYYIAATTNRGLPCVPPVHYTMVCCVPIWCHIGGNIWIGNAIELIWRHCNYFHKINNQLWGKFSCSNPLLYTHDTCLRQVQLNIFFEALLVVNSNVYS